ncbi:glycosyltransferase family 4 protein [Pseudoalteromonas piratica]|uniref:Glycosyl transferase family 1 domain-containing protein n=1 Tax=Pseudoalteromonas piratica TaxID=1348114 RepID=A0A0A7EDL6_9GAMM|nr:glycosyltransferase family 4 protein [Pseudoalteromonas piratica]AIY64603.1 hypothetical protein OM33_05150 [Pseudoalteromonas piratica]
MKKVLVLHAQVPFVRGGAELLVEGLVSAINNKLEGVEAELVMLPYKWYPEEQIISDLMAWRCLDLSETNGKKIDLVIGTKFPTYATKHENKVTWLVHQHRYFYDLEGTEYDKPILSKSEIETRNQVRSLDTKFINESKKIFTIAHTVSDRLMKFNKTEGEVLFPPSMMADLIYPGEYKDYILCVARVNPMKRQDLLIEALRHTKSGVKVKIVGKGEAGYEVKLKDLIDKYDLHERVELVGFVSEDDLLSLYANCRAVYYGPVDEDYGYATIEGFLAKKPVITVKDSGEVARIVSEVDGGWVTKPTSRAIANILDEVVNTPIEELETKVTNAHKYAKDVTWNNVLEKLVTPFL